MSEHLIIPSAYPDEPALHLMRHDDGDIGVGLGDGKRWPGTAMTLSHTTKRTSDAWCCVAGLFKNTKDQTAEARLLLGLMHGRQITSGERWAIERAWHGTTVGEDGSVVPTIAAPAAVAVGLGIPHKDDAHKAARAIDALRLTGLELGSIGTEHLERITKADAYCVNRDTFELWRGVCPGRRDRIAGCRINDYRSAAHILDGARGRDQ